MIAIVAKLRRWVCYHLWRRKLGCWVIVRTPRGYEMRWSVPVGDWYFYASDVWSEWWDALAIAQDMNAAPRTYPSHLGGCRETFPDLRASQAA